MTDEELVKGIRFHKEKPKKKPKKDAFDDLFKDETIEDYLYQDFRFDTTKKLVCRANDDDCISWGLVSLESIEDSVYFQEILKYKDMLTSSDIETRYLAFTMILADSGIQVKKVERIEDPIEDSVGYRIKPISKKVLDEHLQTPAWFFIEYFVKKLRNNKRIKYYIVD